MQNIFKGQIYMTMKISRLNEENLFLSNRECKLVEDVFKDIEIINGNQNLYDYFKENIYINEEDRHYKLGISQYMNNTYLHAREDLSEELDVLISKLKEMVKFTEESIDIDENWRIIRISKLIEHMSLEQIRINASNSQNRNNQRMKENLGNKISDIEKKSEDLEVLIQDTNEASNKIKKDLDETVRNTKEEIQESKSSIYKEILSIVGIFTAISFGAFGGMSVLNTLFGKVGEKGVELDELIILGCIASICVLTLLYIFINYLSKMTGLEIECSNATSFSKKHPVLVYSYTFLFGLLFLGLVAHIINSNKETWNLFIKWINKLLIHKINNLS